MTAFRTPPPPTVGPAAPARRVRSPIAVPAVAFVTLATVYSTFVVVGHRQLRTSGFDLGIFVQQVSSYADLRPPTSDLLGTGYNTLGDHFSPITALLAPVYALVPSPLTLLVAQAVLFAVGVIPLTRWAVRDLGSAAAIVVAIGYGLSFGLQSALNFDFHEIAFGVPLLAFSVTALGRGRWRTALAWSLPLVFVKEDMGLTVAVIGILAAAATTGRDRTLALATTVWGLGWTAMAVKVVIPALSPSDTYSQGRNLPPLGSGIADTAHGLAAGDSRAATLLLLLAITGFAALRSPLTFVAIPTIAWRYLSDNTNYWVPNFHYNAVLMPILFAALVDALIRGRRDWHLTDRARRVILGAVLVVAVGSFPFSPLARLLHPDGWRTDPRLSTMAEIADMIPESDQVAVSNNLAAQLVATHPVTVFPQRPSDTTTPDWIVVNRGNPPNWPTDAAGDARAVSAALASGFRLVKAVDGIEVLERR